jgi:selenocysteine-specific elongation factor
VHGDSVDAVEATSRVAANLVGLEVAQVVRGDVLARPATLLGTSMIDVDVSLIEAIRPLRDQARVRVHVASAEVLARVRLLGGADVIEAGGSGFAQLRLERPAVAGYGDRLILRSYSPSTTIGGAIVLDPLPSKRRRRERAHLVDVRALRGASPIQAARQMVSAAGSTGIAAAALAARITMPLAELLSGLADDAGSVLVGSERGSFISRTALDELAQQTEALLERFHANEPLRSAMAREELRGRLFARCPAGVFEHVLGGLIDGGRLRALQDGVALSRHSIELSPEEQGARAGLLEAAAEAGLTGLDLQRVAAKLHLDLALLERVSRVLLGEGQLDRVGDALLVERSALEALAAEVRRRWPPGSKVDVAGFKQLTGLTRKYLIPLLEYLDREKVTRRSGNDRIVLG